MLHSDRLRCKNSTPQDSRAQCKPFETDYYLTHFGNGLNDRQNNFRFSVGVIFRFGGK